MSEPRKLTIGCPLCLTQTASPTRQISEDAMICTCTECGLPFTLLCTESVVARVAELNGLSIPVL